MLQPVGQARKSRIEAKRPASMPASPASSGRAGSRTARPAEQRDHLAEQRMGQRQAERHQGHQQRDLPPAAAGPRMRRACRAASPGASRRLQC
jgi:hypothetical protein